MSRDRPGGAWFTALLGGLTAFGPMSIDMYLPAMPALAGTLRASPGSVQLTLSAFFVGFGLGQLVYGPISDRWGRKPPMLAGIGFYVAASLLCAFAWGVAPLIVFRLLQGLSAGAGPLLARAMVRDLYERDRGASMLSLMMLIMGAAPLLAPLVGGQLLLAFGWRSIFEVQAAFGGACLLGAWLGVPETLDVARRANATAAAMMSRYATLLRDPAYLGYVVSSGAAYAGMFAYFAGSPFVFIELYHVTPQRYGLLFALNVVGMMACAAVNSRLVLRYGADRLLRYGVTMVAAAGGVLLLAAVTGWGGLPGLVLPIVAFVASISFVGANAMAGALARFRHVAGTASALAGTFQFGLGALSGMVIGALYGGTAVPMAAVMAAMGLLSAVTHRLLVARRV
ncbi:MAG TPA: Bcr/CflA family multidrug efflux MFS transporter [bacterium]|nr:Bcr/CflA family multidrug efflux MFS transporter [bacterium]